MSKPSQSGRIGNYKYELYDATPISKEAIRFLPFGPIAGQPLSKTDIIELYSDRNGNFLVCLYRQGTKPSDISMWPARAHPCESTLR